jgi:hypothetical protein
MKYHMKSQIPVLLPSFVIFWLAACAAPPPPSAPMPTATATWTATAAVPTRKPTRTPPPTPTDIPGFEGWSVLNPQAVEIKSEDGGLVMTLKQRALWFMERRGVLMYKPVDGNFKITAEVYTAKSSDPSQPPGGDSTVQLGGLMARNGNSGQENYVFIVAGNDGDGLSIETKNTIESFSKYSGPVWDSAEAELRLCRFGATFNLYKRHVGSNEAWTPAATFDRPDLPQTLQVGLNIYTDSAPDLQIRYDHIKIEPVSNSSDCEML